MNKIFETKEIAPNNRGLFAIQPIKSSQKILQCQPLALATLKALKGQTCNWCLMRKEVVRCAACRSVYYCSKECQKNDWSVHKLECKIYQNMVNNKKLSVHQEITTQFVLNLRIALLIKNDKRFEEQFMKMVSLKEHQVTEKMQNFQELSVVLLQNLGEEKSQANISRMMQQLNIVAINAFTIQDFLCETDGVAIGIYGQANYMNHDCQPNCTQYFDGRFLTVVANRQIQSKQQITISYTNPLALADERRKFLRDNYLFQCFCQLCQVETMINTKFKYVICPDCQGQIARNQEEEQAQKLYQCASCERKFTLKEMEGRVVEIQKMMENFQKLGTNEYIKKSFFMVKKVLSLKHPFFADAIDKVYHATINSLQQADQERQRKLLEEAYILLKEEIKGIPTWYRLEEGEEDSVRFFIKFAQFGKLCYNLGKFQKAFEYTEKAYKIIQKCKLKNKYQEIAQLCTRYQELKIELSMAKAQSFKKS